MPSLVVPLGAQLRLIWQQSGVDAAVNVIGVRNGAPVVIDQTLANTLDTAIKASFTSSGLKALTSSTWALASVGIRDIATAAQPEYLGSGAAVAGTNVATNALPANVAYCVTIRTANAGKRFRGRYYQVGATSGQSDAAGLPVAAYRTAVVSFITTLRANLVTSNLDLAVISRVNLFAYTMTTAVGRRLVWNTQRRRLIAGI